MVATSRARLAICYLAARKYGQAETEANKSIEVASRLGIREDLWLSHWISGEALYAQKRRPEALKRLRQTIETLDEIGRELSAESFDSFRKRTDVKHAVARTIATLNEMRQVDEASRIQGKYQ